MQAFNRENVAKVKNQAGNYYFYGSTGNLLYCGFSAVLRHRLQSYYQKDDFSEHPTKRPLRPRIRFFSVVYRPVAKAKKIDRLMAPRAPFKVMKPGMRR